MSSSDTLYLIDGSGFIFRAYHGIRAPMTAVDGTPTNAVYGFMRLLMNLLRDREPAHIAVVFDPPGGSFRTDLYPAYKANRAAPPTDLIPQFGLCREATRALGLQAIEVARFEADDVIGTMADRWTRGGRPCIIVTADKDLMQLVDDRTLLWDGKEKQTDRAGVIERFGVPPERVVDVLGLAGDSSDNIPGVPGIGEKTASALLAEYVTLEALLAAASTIKGKKGQSLVEFADQARLSAMLATIRRDVPLPTECDDDRIYARTPPNPEVLRTFLERLAFRQFQKELGLVSVAGPDAAAGPDGATRSDGATRPDGAHVGGGQLDRSVYRMVLTAEALEDFLAAAKAAGRLAVDLETTGLDTLTARVVGFALAHSPGKAVYVPVAHDYPGVPTQLSLASVVDLLRPLLEDPAFPKLGQNVKYECQILRNSLGIEYQGLSGDSMLAAYLLDSGRRSFNLDGLAADYLGHRMLGFKEVAGTSGEQNDGRFARVELETATQYAGEDADVALRLCDVMHPRLTEAGLDAVYHKLELPLARVLSRIESYGIKLDAFMLRSQSLRFATRIADLEVEIYAAAGGEFKIGSPKQLGELLFEKLLLPRGKKTKTGYSTDQEVLEGLQGEHPVPGLVLKYRHLTKLKSTYLDTLPSLIHPLTGRLHTSFRQAVAATGRLSSSDPNLQNIPIRSIEGREIRRAFVAQPGWKLLSADYSQVELRVLAHFSDDPGLMQAFADDADVHARTAADVFGVPEAAVTPEQRRQAKAINFGLIYGMGPFRLANELGITQASAKGIIKQYFERYPGVRRYFDQTVEDARTAKRIRTLFGRIRDLPDINSSNANIRQGAERIAVNTPIQGTAADLLKQAMITLDARLSRERRRSRILLTVHDELVLEVPDDELSELPAIVAAEMEGAASLKVPLKVEIGVGDNWAEIH